MPKRGQILVPRITVACPCGKSFETTQKILDQGKGRYCSRPCMYKYRTRPTGLAYDLKAPNPAWYSKGNVPHNAGTAKPKELKGRPRGEQHHAWKGDDVGYAALHDWVSLNYQKADACDHCCCTDKPLDWANKTGQYRRDRDDWLNLCRPCHKRYDLTRSK